MGWQSRFWAFWGALAVALLLLVPTSAHASGALVGVPLSTCTLPAAEGMTPAMLFARPDRFDCTTPQSRFEPGDYWILSQPLDDIAEREARSRVRVASQWQQDIALYALYPDGHVASLPLNGRQTSRHVALGAMVEWRLPRHRAAPVRLLWRVRGAANVRGILSLPRLATPSESARANLQMGAFYAGFAGLCIALLAYNLAMYTALRHRFQLAYCVMVAALAAYALTSSGALAWALPDLLNNDRLRLNFLMLAVAAAAGIEFARMFFKRELRGSHVSAFATAACIFLLVVTIALVVLAPWQLRLLNLLYAVAFAAMLAAMLAIIAQARRRRSPYLWLFGVAWSAPILFGTLRMLANFDVIGWSFWLDNSTILAMGCEALLSTVAIAYRIRLLSIERDAAHRREIAARMLAELDPLTGLMNRRSFIPRMSARAGEQKLMLVDIDHFKRINETIGHDGGDEVLRIFARTLRAALPPDTTVARLGGEEFAVVLAAADAVGGEMLLSRLRAARMPFDVTVTASIGIALGPLASEFDWKRLYRRADRALFAAKAAGRDRVRRAEDLEPAT